MAQFMNRIFTILIVAFLPLSFFGCAGHAHMMIGKRRPPIKPDQVRIFTTPPPKYEEIAIIDSSSINAWVVTTQGKMDAATNGLRKEAAALGANGVLLRSVGDQTATSGGIGFGTASAYGSTAYGSGSWYGRSDYAKIAQGVAIYVP